MAYNVVGHDHRPLEHAVEEASEAAPRAWVMPLALLLATGACALTIWNVTRILHGPPVLPVPTPVAAKQALYLGVMKLEAFRRVHGAIPDTMMEAGLTAGSGYVYTRVDPGHYVLMFEDRSARQTYDSTTSIESAFGPPREMFALGTNGDTE